MTNKQNSIHKNSRFEFSDGQLIDFWIEDPHFECFGGLVYVKAKLVEVENLPGCKFVLQSNEVYQGVTYSQLWTDYSERPVSIGHKDGVVVGIGYSDPM